MSEANPRLFLVLHRKVDETVLEERIEVSLDQLERARPPGDFLMHAVRTILAQGGLHG